MIIMALPSYTETRYIVWHYIYISICTFVFFFLIAPLIVIFPLSFNAEENIAVNLDNMKNAVTAVLSGFVCVAERDAKIDGVEIKKGQYIGSLNNKILYSDEAHSKALLGILSKSNMYPGTLVTIYWGLESNEEESDSLAALIESGHKGVETEVVFGGQPYYNYILSLE